MAEDLFVCNYPLYTIATLSNGEFYVAGGGGQQKTGVPNGLELHSINVGGEGYSSKLILQHDMGGNLIMNSEPHPKDRSIIAVGIGYFNHLLEIQRESSKHSANLKMVKSVRTDFSDKDSYQKVVRFNHDGSLIVTGGCDGIVRLWKYPDMKDKVELRGHKKEIEDIACHPNENQVVSICRGGEALVWDVTKRRQLKQFTWQPDQFRLKSCRFSPTKDDQGKYWLYSISVPQKISQRASKRCYILKWCTSSWKPSCMRAVANGLACTMAINVDGSRLAVGTAEGNASVYNHNLQVLHSVARVHSVFITGLTFARLGTGGKSDSDGTETEVLLSVSADRSCSVTPLNRKGGSKCCDFKLCFFVLLPVLLVFVSAFVLALFVV